MTLYQQAEGWLQDILGPQATFRDGQWEAISALVERRERVLVVQRTGWGKSMVYFMATRLLRGQGAGITLLVSPLLALMRNQIESAKQWGVRAMSINSTNPDDHSIIEYAALTDQLDLLLISPERLANDRFQSKVWATLRNKVGLLVIDEAHCISDWGHDFRPNYRRIMGVLDQLPKQTPVLGTTATANDRVVQDVSEIIGAGMNIQRGPLTRDSLALYVYADPKDHAERLTLLSHLLRSIPGSGIIYCTTTRDCSVVAEWLQQEGFNVKAYFSNVDENGGETREALEDQLLNNQVKALVASVALGMGFDKPDLHFVIHYQQPGNLIGYYQQIGRAGRGIANAHIILMHGAGDEDIQNHFIENAFPQPKHVNEVLDVLGQLPKTNAELQREVNVNKSTLEKIMTHLEVEGIVAKEGSAYQLVRRGQQPDYERWNGITQQRYDEMAQMRAYIAHTGCYMRFIAQALDDPTAPAQCGRCKNCRQQTSKYQPNLEDIQTAQQFLRGGRPLTFEPRKQWPSGLYPKMAIEHRNEVGLALSQYYAAGWGELVKKERLKAEGHFSGELVAASVAVLEPHLATLATPPQWVTYVPSLRRDGLVSKFAERLAAALGLPIHHVVVHNQQHRPQAEMRNSFQQAQNLIGAFGIDPSLPNGPVLLVDDVADSRWTLTTLGAQLQKAGSGPVYPFVLATTGMGD